jgi:hypothetical protein
VGPEASATLFNYQGVTGQAGGQVLLREQCLRRKIDLLRGWIFERASP